MAWAAMERMRKTALNRLVRGQVGLSAQVFHGVALFLHGIAGIAGADHIYLLRLDFKGLLRAGGQGQKAGDLDGAA